MSPLSPPSGLPVAGSTTLDPPQPAKTTRAAARVTSGRTRASLSLYTTATLVARLNVFTPGEASVLGDADGFPGSPWYWGPWPSVGVWRHGGIAHDGRFR